MKMKGLLPCLALTLIAGCTTTIKTTQEKSSELASAYLNKSKNEYDLGQFDLAVADATKAIDNKKDMPSAYEIRGKSYRAKGFYDQARVKEFNSLAISDFSAAIKLNPYYEYYVERGISYDESGLYDESITDSTKAIELKPDDVEAYNTLGNAYSGKGLYEKAIANFTKAIDINPKYARAYFNRGIEYASRGHYYKDVIDATTAIVLKPDFADAYASRGFAYLNMGLYDQSALSRMLWLTAPRFLRERGGAAKLRRWKLSSLKPSGSARRGAWSAWTSALLKA